MKADRSVRGIYVLPAVFAPVFALLWATMGFADGAKATAILLIATLTLVPLVIAMLLTPVAIHELGHLWAGRRAGYRFVSIQVGPWTWDGRRLRTDWKVGLPMGLCVMHPRYGLPTWGEAVAFVAGGPLASLGAGLLGLAFFLGTGGRLEWTHPFSGEGWRATLQLLGLLAFVGNGSALAGSLVPQRSGGMASDGLQLLDLYRRRFGR